MPQTKERVKRPKKKSLAPKNFVDSCNAYKCRYHHWTLQDFWKVCLFTLKRHFIWIAVVVRKIVKFCTYYNSFRDLGFARFENIREGYTLTYICSKKKIIILTLLKKIFFLWNIAIVSTNKTNIISSTKVWFSFFRIIIIWMNMGCSRWFILNCVILWTLLKFNFWCMTD